MRPDEPEFLARVEQYRAQLARLTADRGHGRGCHEALSREGAMLEIMQRIVKDDDRDLEDRHIAMDALLCAYAPEPVADLFASARRWYS